MFMLNPRRSVGAVLSLAAIVLPYVATTGPTAAQQDPGDLPARATLSAQLLGTAEARLESCRQSHEAAFIAAWECNGRVAAAQTALAGNAPTPTSAP